MTHTLNTLGRRGFLAAAGSALAGCDSGMSLIKSPGVCDQPMGKQLIVDIHCHLMNLRDADDDAFVVRHFTDADEKGPLASFVAGLATNIAALPNHFVTESGKEEFEWLSSITKSVQGNPQAFCNAASNRQSGLIFAAEGRHVLGFASNRARNAALLMDRYPQVDIFTPLMVDFYEGKGPYSHPEELVDFYSQLNVATLGRFLPMVSFNPARAWAERDRPPGQRHLDMVRNCIEKKGFVGVKMHPSTGFAPIENVLYGCPNSPLQKLKSIPEDQAKFYDNILQDLLVYCRGADVPILIHSGEGIPANRGCMQHTFVAHAERPNAPPLWERAIQMANRHQGSDFAGTPVNPERRLRFCFGHLAGGFTEVKGRAQPHPWLRMMEGIMRRNPDVYIDLSDFTEPFEDRSSDRNPRYPHLMKYQDAFRSFLSDNKAVGQNMMYGSDWHMPSVAAVGKDYLAEIEAMIPEVLRPRTMGLNAIDFLGLAPGRTTRARLERFYRAKDVHHRIPWMEKIAAKA